MDGGLQEHSENNLNTRSVHAQNQDPCLGLELEKTKYLFSNRDMVDRKALRTTRTRSDEDLGRSDCQVRRCGRASRLGATI